MALQKDKETSFGVVGNYHRLIQFNISALDWSGGLTVALYKDSQARLDGKEPLELKSYGTPANVFSPANMNNSDPISLAYAWIMSNDPFYGDALSV